MAEYNPSKIIKDGNTYNFRDNTKIPLSGTNALAGSIVPSTNNSYDLGSSTYKLRYVYCGTAYVTNLNINGTAAGDILTHNASEFVDVTTAQTIGGIKIFSDIPIVANGKTYSSQISADRINGRKSDFSANNGFKIICDQNSDAWINTAFAIHLTDYSPTSGQINFKLYDCIENSTSYKGFFFKKDGNNFQLSPTSSNSTDLGSSTNKWKTLNGVSPGALSLSDIGSYISIDTSQWDVTLSNNILGSFTPAVDGWVIMQLNPINADTDIWIIGGNMRTNYKTTVNPLDNSKFIMCYFPVLKGYTYTIYGHNSMPLSVVSIARLYSCQGNV